MEIYKCTNNHRIEYVEKDWNEEHQLVRELCELSRGMGLQTNANRTVIIVDDKASGRTSGRVRHTLDVAVFDGTELLCVFVIYEGEMAGLRLYRARRTQRAMLFGAPIGIIHDLGDVFEAETWLRSLLDEKTAQKAFNEQIAA